jgi:hypothetical protein
MAAPNLGPWRLPVRWLGGGIAILAFAEMLTACLAFASAACGLILPPLMLSPWRSTSIAEFWTRRWNPATSALLHASCFAPLARHSAALALWTTFFVSGLAHFLLAFMAIGLWGLSLIYGAFFLVQPLLIAVERGLHVRHWPVAAARVWTLLALAVTSPLFVEPMFRVVDASWGPPGSVLPPVLAVLGFTIFLSSSVALASLTARPDAAPVSASENLANGPCGKKSLLLF